MLLFVNHANVSTLTPLNELLVTNCWQFPFTFPLPYSWIDVSISAASHNTNNMKLPRIITPGINWRWEAIQRMATRKRMAREETVMLKGKILEGGC